MYTLSCAYECGIRTIAAATIYATQPKEDNSTRNSEILIQRSEIKLNLIDIKLSLVVHCANIGSAERERAMHEYFI